MIDQERDHPIDKLLRRIAGNPTPTAADRNRTWRVLAEAIRRESLSRVVRLVVPEIDLRDGEPSRATDLRMARKVDGHH